MAPRSYPLRSPSVQTLGTSAQPVAGCPWSCPRATGAQTCATRRSTAWSGTEQLFCKAIELRQDKEVSVLRNGWQALAAFKKAQWPMKRARLLSRVRAILLSVGLTMDFIPTDAQRVRFLLGSPPEITHSALAESPTAYRDVLRASAAFLHFTGGLRRPLDPRA